MHNPLDHDDAPIGQVLTRREALTLLGGVGAYGVLWTAGCARGTDGKGGNKRGSTTGAQTRSIDCAAKPELTEGPYYVEDKLTRADIRSNSATGALEAGTLLTLGFNVSRIQSKACTPLAGAVVDVWHCNALGVYSDVQDPGFDTRGQDWLRGNLTTDANGAATFTTIVPGWYPGRASHIHFRIRSAASAHGTYEFTSQLFFPENLLASVYSTKSPYSTRGDGGRLRNANDGIYARGGSQLLINPTARGDGYAATFNIGLYTGV